MFSGIITALATPFRDGRLDEPALRELCEWQIAEGIHGLVVCGSTGEAAALSTEEKVRATRIVVEQAKQRVPVIAGSGTNSTASTVELTRAMAAARPDGVLVVTPYYVKPTQAGLIEHYRAVAAIGLPVVAYNVPGRTGVSLTADTAARLAAIDNIVALKEASADLRLDASMARVAGKLSLLSGDDFTLLAFLAVGGRGCISVASNVAPRQMVALYDRFRASDIAGAREIQLALLPLMDALFLESNPIPVKAALWRLGRIQPEIRAPLTWMSPEQQPKLFSAMAALGLEARP